MFGADIDADVMSALNDGCGHYIDAGGVLRAKDIELIIDHNLQRVGPNGALVADALGITYRKAAMQQPERGGVFVFACKRYVVEEIVIDDGDFATAACMEDV